MEGSDDTISALVIDKDSLKVLDAALIEDAWFRSYELPPEAPGIRRIRIDGCVYILSRDQEDISDLLVVDVSVNGVFRAKDNKRAIFERILRVAMRHFDRSLSIPASWQPYHEGSRLSVYAVSLYKSSMKRIYFEQSPDGDENIFAYAQTDKPEELLSVVPKIDIYLAARNSYFDALTSNIDKDNFTQVGQYGILLSEPLGRKLSTPGTLTDWHDRLLSEEQRDFVKRDHSNPVRLRGAAGTGKTQAMVVKCLWDLYNRSDSDKTFAFLTHSSSLAHDVVRGMLSTLDPTERWSSLVTPDGQSRLWVGTLYELAQKQLGYVEKGLRPLSLDGREGRELQRLLIDEAIDLALRDPTIIMSANKDCPDFFARLSDRNFRGVLVEELMNEFACVLDAENIRKGTPEAERYIHAVRESWQMPLNSGAEAKVVIQIHDNYRTFLRRENFLSIDQMVADHARYLMTHEWSQLRERIGFDLIFVDEYHYFTRMEAMLLHNLFKGRASNNQKWPLMMAYDLKQSVSDAGLSGGAERFRNPGVGETVPVDLKEVFRSTPQIAQFLQSLDGAFPAIDLEGEFEAYQANSNQVGGDIPVCFEYIDDVALVDDIFERAESAARSIDGGGREVAVLCLNENLFDVYRKASRIQDRFVSMTSREDLRQLRYAKRKVVFSMPEYVAGLQFSQVFIIHFDDVDLTDDSISAGTRRRYVSRAYLGASRASHSLFIASSKARGGASSILAGAFADGTLRKA